jgi:hypothetical protein
MKATSTEHYAEILANLKSGHEICGILPNGCANGHIYYNLLTDCIHWEHYGSSANAATPDELSFVFETIFKDCITWDYCEFSEYHINYKPLNSAYICIDLSRMHLNTFGK